VRPLLLVLLLAACASSGPLPEQPLTSTTSASVVASWSAWPQASHDARRSGSSTAHGPTSGKVRWSRTLEGNVTPGPVVGVDGTVVAASNAGVLHGLDPATGADRWVFDGGGAYGLDLSTSPAVLPDGTVLWPGPHNTLYALDAHGRLLWMEPLRGQPTSPAVEGTRVVVGDSQGGVTAFSVTAGSHRRLWSVDVGGSSYGSVALSPTDPRRSYQTVDRALVALDDGTVAWRRQLREVTEVSPAVGPDGTVVVGDNSADEYAFHPDGRTAWRYEHGGQTYSSPVVTADGTAWFGDHRAYVTGVDVRTGRVRARFRGESVEPPHGPSVGVWTSPVVDADHHVYWGTRLGHVYGRAPDGKLLFDVATGATVDSYPALTADGLLIVGVTDGRLLALG
jgi:outer membrane protein assembly factor BamB